MSPEEWHQFLLNWQQQVLESNEYVKAFYVLDVFPELADGPVVPSGSAEAVEALETRLGKELPASYRNFLLAAEGWAHITMFARFLPPAEVGWFYDTNKDWVDVWIEGSGDYDVTDEDYFVYGAEQDCINIRAAYMKSCLKLSTDEDGYVFLLNPEITTEDGEWEAWAFGAKLPGAMRFRTFEDMMRAEYETALLDIKQV